MSLKPPYSDKPVSKPKPKVQVAAPPAPAPEPEGDILEFAKVILNKRTYMRNCRGDILDEKYDWVGRLKADGKTIDTSFPKPDDLDSE